MVPNTCGQGQGRIKGVKGAKGSEGEWRGGKGAKGSEGEWREWMHFYTRFQGPHHLWRKKLWWSHIVLMCPHHLEVQCPPNLHLHSCNGLCRPFVESFNLWHLWPSTIAPSQHCTLASSLPLNRPHLWPSTITPSQLCAFASSLPPTITPSEHCIFASSLFQTSHTCGLPPSHLPTLYLCILTPF